METSEKADVRVRHAIRNDLPALQEIERASFSCPWSEQEFLSALAINTVVCLVAESGWEKADPLIGFVVYDRQDDRIDLLSLAVEPAWRRRGVATALVRKVCDKLSAKRPTISAMLHEDNLPSQLFFKAQGFRATRVLRDFYKPKEAGGLGAGDAYQFRYDLIPTDCTCGAGLVEPGGYCGSGLCEKCFIGEDAP